jgi:hypothetical protein
VATLPISCKRGHPLGSRNKKTLAALVAATTATSAEAVPAATAAAATAEAAAATTAAATSIRAAPTTFATAAIGNSSGTVVGAARKSRRPSEKQRLSYTSKNGYTTFLAPLRARCKVRLPLPFHFIDMMGGNILMHTIVEECSGDQPLYPVEIFHDGEGKSYLRDSWPKFVEDYDLKMGWSLIFTCHEGSHFFCVCIVDISNCARTYSAWA